MSYLMPDAMLVHLIRPADCAICWFCWVLYPVPDAMLVHLIRPADCAICWFCWVLYPVPDAMLAHLIRPAGCAICWFCRPDKAFTPHPATCLYAVASSS
ncbi:hypothetical protein, partial [Escherichia marmotae]|uniref:hypothetical protein n=1 Tax=Escherichia marmotae TaxID=1499973 RepID=UPI001A9C7D0D